MAEILGGASDLQGCGKQRKGEVLRTQHVSLPQWCRTSCRTSARLHCFGYLRTLQTSARI